MRWLVHLGIVAGLAAACGPATTRSLIEQHQLDEALTLSQGRPSERDAVAAALVEALNLRVVATVMPHDARATLLGDDAALLSHHGLVKVRPVWNEIHGVHTRATWRWNDHEAIAPTLFALAALTGEKRELTPMEKLADLGRATALVAACGVSIGTACPAQSLGPSNASKVVLTEASAPKAARLVRALARSGFVLVPMESADEPVRLTVELGADASTCETAPCGALTLVASMLVPAGPPAVEERVAAFFASREVPFAAPDIALVR